MTNPMMMAIQSHKKPVFGTVLKDVRIDYRQDDTYKCSPDDTFLLEAGKRCLSMTTLDEGFRGVRIALLKTQKRA